MKSISIYTTICTMYILQYVHCILYPKCYSEDNNIQYAYCAIHCMHCFQICEYSALQFLQHDSSRSKSHAPIQLMSSISVIMTHRREITSQRCTLYTVHCTYVHSQTH